MAYAEADIRAYVDRRFPRASAPEREKLVQDWLTKPKVSAGIAADFERRVALLAGMSVLDAGSGNGGIGIAFASRGAKVEGVEIEEDLVSIARATAEAEGSSAHFILYDGSALPFPDQAFDAAISVSVIEHVDDPVRYFSEILRVLKPGGYLYLAFPNRLNPKETHTGLWFLSYLPVSLARWYAQAAGHNPLEDNGLHFYTFWAVRRFLRAAEAQGRRWTIKEEPGQGTGAVKTVVKRLLRAFGIPHQALLPHVMLVLQAS